MNVQHLIITLMQVGKEYRQMAERYRLSHLALTSSKRKQRRCNMVEGRYVINVAETSSVKSFLRFVHTHSDAKLASFFLEIQELLLLLWSHGI